MTRKPRTDVLGSLPSTRPHRRSGKRPPRGSGETATGAPAVLDAPASGDQVLFTPKPAPADGGRRSKTARTPAAQAKGSAGPRGARRTASPAARGTRISQPAQPHGTPRPGRKRAAPRPAAGEASGGEGQRLELVSLAVQAAAEIAEIGITVSARTLRRAVARLPRP